MLKQIDNTRQIPGEPPRKWFASNTFDLIVWYAEDDGIAGFQLCYHKDMEEKALTWMKDGGFSHKRVDDGEDRPGHAKMTPILVPDGIFEKDRVAALFEDESQQLDPEIINTVREIIATYPI